MNDLGHDAQVALPWVLIWIVVVYESVGAAMGNGRLMGQPVGLAGFVARIWMRHSTPPGLVDATLSRLIIVALQVLPLCVLVWPDPRISLLARLLTLGFFAAEAIWFRHLSRCLEGHDS